MKKSPQPPRIQETIMAAIGKGIRVAQSPAALALTALFALTHLASAQDNVLINPGFEDGNKDGWTAVGDTPVKEIGATDTYYNAGQCAPDSPAEAVLSHSGDWVGNIYGNFNAPINLSSWSQIAPTIASSTYTAGAWTYASHEDLMAGANYFYYEVDFLSSSNSMLASYESFIITNLACPPTATTFPLDTWVFLAVTNDMQVTSGTNTGVVTGNTGVSGVMTAPAGTASVQWTAKFVNVADAGGSIYIDDCELYQLTGPVPPSLSAISPTGVILATNTALTCAATSSDGVITNVQVIVTTSPLGGTSTTVTNKLGSAGLTVTGTNTATAQISYALTANLIYNVTVIAEDSIGFQVSGTSSFDTIRPALVIEAEDFNYSGGGYTNTPPDGGLALYTNQVGVQDIDENKGNPKNGTQGYYRPSDAVIIQAAAPDNGTEQKYITAAANGDTVDVPVEVGYNSPKDWVDYTRDYGSAATNSAPAGTYYIYGRLATDGDGNPGLTISQVTSDAAETNQTQTVLGTFNFADTDWNGFDYVPLEDQFGNLVSVNLSGRETLRETTAGNVNCDFYMLVAATPVLTPILQYFYPNGSHPFEYTNSFSFTVGAANGAGIPSSGIDLVVNGVDVTSKLAFTGATNSWSSSYAILPNSVYTAVINVTNSAGLVSTFTKNFDTFNPNSFQWEADDYDFTTNGVSGLFIDNSVPTCDTTAPDKGHEETNSYFAFPGGITGAVATLGIDFTCGSLQPEANDYYRADGQGCQPASDYVRPKFVAAQVEFSDPNIGPFNIGWTTTGDWENYTRTYPTGNFNVWGRIAGGSTAWSGEQLDIITSGYGTANQTSNILGTFSDPNPAGYQAWHWIPLEDTNGNMVTVPLGGKATLQIVCGGPGVNEEFYMLVPAATQLSPSLGAALVAGQLIISIPTLTGHTYQVYYSASLSPSSWGAVGSAITGDGNVHTVSETTSGSQGYYEVEVQ